jgi:hypothetical protein
MTDTRMGGSDTSQDPTRTRLGRTPTTDQRTQKFFENHPKLREAVLGTAGGAGIPESQNVVKDLGKGLWSTITEPPKSKDEYVFAGALPAYRIAKGLVQQAYGYGQEAFDSVDWSSTLDKAKNGPKDKYDAIVTFKPGSGGSPQAVHAIAGLSTMIASVLSGGKKVPEVGDAATHAVKDVGKAVTEGPTVTAQYSAGTGPDLAKQVTRDAIKDRSDAVNAADEARKSWVEKSYKAKKSIAEAATVEGKKEAIRSAQDTYIKRLMDNVKEAHDATRKTLDERWGQLRKDVGTDHAVQAPNIYNSIEQSRAMLAGVPADLKLFNDLVKEITEKGEKVETESGELRNVPKESIPFDDARTQFSAVGEKAYAAEGNLRRALFNVYEAYDKSLSKAASEAGQGKTYAALKNDWKRYMQDWHDMHDMATGGSPLARLKRAVDPKVVEDTVYGKFGDRLFGTFARYRGQGADPGLLGTMRKLAQDADALPKATAAKMPERPSPETVRQPEPITVDDVVKKLKEAKGLKAEKVADKMKAVTKYQTALAGLAGYGIGSALTGGGGSHLWYAVPYTIVNIGGLAFAHSEAGLSWLSKITPQDVAKIKQVLAKAPEHAAEVQQGITDGLIEKARKGQPLPPLSTFQGLLTRAQLGSILRVVAPPQSQQSAQQTQPSSVQ